MGLRRIILDCIATVGRMLVSTVSVNKSIWIFGAWKGQLYSDNARYMFEYVLREHKEIEAVWITRNDDVYRKLKAEGVSVYKRFSLQGICTIAKAGVAFETEGEQDISPFMNKKTLIVEMWHGGVSPKRFRWKGFNAGHMGEHRRKSYWMTSSKQNSELLQEEFGLQDDHLIITGYPRNDIFFSNHKANRVIQILEERNPGARKIIYMPTHRSFGSKGSAFTADEMLSIDKKLADANIVMLYKPHFHELKNFLNIEDQFTHIVFAKDQELYGDVYSYIWGFDALISDYSSIMYDFLCAKKPIVMFPFDYESYQASEAGVYSFYEEYPLGPVCYTWSEVVEELERILANDRDWAEKGEIARKYFHPFDDGKNCERVFNATMKLLEEKGK